LRKNAYSHVVRIIVLFPRLAVPVAASSGRLPLVKIVFEYQPVELIMVILSFKIVRSLFETRQSSTCLHVGECKGKGFPPFLKLYLPSFRSSEA
jgi:hypothetical protein